MGHAMIAQEVLKKGASSGGGAPTPMPGGGGSPKPSPKDAGEKLKKEQGKGEKAGQNSNGMPSESQTMDMAGVAKKTGEIVGKAIKAILSGGTSLVQEGKEQSEKMAPKQKMPGM